jgi:hypothetical protein
VGGSFARAGRKMFGDHVGCDDAFNLSAIVVYSSQGLRLVCRYFWIAFDVNAKVAFSGKGGRVRSFGRSTGVDVVLCGTLCARGWFIAVELETAIFGDFVEFFDTEGAPGLKLLFFDKIEPLLRWSSAGSWSSYFF